SPISGDGDQILMKRNAAISWHFEREPIPYALETDWPVGAGGFEPLHLEIEPVGVGDFSLQMRRSTTTFNRDAQIRIPQPAGVTRDPAISVYLRGRRPPQVRRSDILLPHFFSNIFRLPDGQRHDRQSWIFGAASGELAAVGDE